MSSSLGISALIKTTAETSLSLEVSHSTSDRLESATSIKEVVSPFFLVLEDVLKSLSPQSDTTLSCPQFIATPLQELQDEFSGLLTSLNQDKRALTQQLIQARDDFRGYVLAHQEESIQIQDLARFHLLRLQISLAERVSDLYSIQFLEKKKALQERKENQRIQRSQIDQFAQEIEQAGIRNLSLKASIENAEVNLRGQRQLCAQLQQGEEDRIANKEEILQNIAKTGLEHVKSLGKSLGEVYVKIENCKQSIARQYEAFRVVHKEYLLRLGLDPEDISAIANRFKELLERREIAATVNLIQSISYTQLCEVLRCFTKETLDLLPRIFWFHSPYLDPAFAPHEITPFLCVSVDNLGKVAAALYLICCYEPGPSAFELIPLPLPTDKGECTSDWVIAAKVELETIRSTAFEEIAFHLADTKGEMDTHKLVRYYLLSEKAGIRIRGADLAYQQGADKKNNPFTSARVQSLHRSFLLKYTSLSVFVRLSSQFLDWKKYSERATTESFGRCNSSIIDTMKRIFGDDPEERYFTGALWRSALTEEGKMKILEEKKFLKKRSLIPKIQSAALDCFTIGLRLSNVRMIHDAIVGGFPISYWRNPFNGDNLLHWIVRQDFHVAEELLKLGLDPKMKTENNRSQKTPIQVAGLFSSPETLDLVLKYYGDEYIKDHVYWVLKFVLQRKTDFFATIFTCFKIIVDKLLHIDRNLIRRECGDEPLITVLAHNNRVGCLNYLIDREISAAELRVNDRAYCHQKATALFLAAKEGYVDFVKQLLALGAFVEDGNQRDETPLMTAAYHGKWEVMDVLSKSGANLSATSKSGMTPICYAAQGGKIESLKFLVARHISLTEADCSGKHPLWLACEEGKFEMVASILDIAQKSDQLKDIIDKQDTECFRTALFVATQKNQPKIVQKLLALGANPLIPDQFNLLPLSAAAKEGHLECINLLIGWTSPQKDAEYGRWGSTALDCAAKGGYEECCAALRQGNYQHSHYHLSIPDQEGLW